MSHRVPNFEEEYSMPMSSRFLPQRKSIMAEEDELLELLWQNGQVVTQSQNQRCTKRSPPLRFGGDDAVPHGRPEIGSPATAAVVASQLFMQEDEMASWLHYPIEETFDRDFCSDLVFSGSAGSSGVAGRNGQVQVDRKSEEKPPASVSASAPAAAPSRPPIYPARRREAAEGVVNFEHLSRGKGKGDSRPSDARESTVVDSSETPAAGEVRVFQGEKTVAGSGGGNGGCGSTCGGSREREPGTCEGTLTSSSGVSSPSAEDRKRKARQGEESEWQSEDAEYESLAEKKVTRRSTSAKRARAAEVHNLSERRRRDRINEKMKALQELIPRCNKSDKASMLDEAIEYLKSLQLQVQMMSMGCSMAPMMFPGVQQYMPAMGMGIGMGMEMAAASGFVRPMLPFPQVMSGPAMPGPSASHPSPRFPMPPFNLPHIPPSDQTRVQATNMLDPASTSVNLHCTNMPQQSPNLTNPYHHYVGLHHIQGPPQNQATAQQPSTNKGVETPENHQSG